MIIIIISIINKFRSIRRYTRILMIEFDILYQFKIIFVEFDELYIYYES